MKNKKAGASVRKVSFAERRDAWFRHHRYLARDSLVQLIRNPVSTMLTWLVIAISLTLPAIMYLVLINLQQLTAPLSEGAQVTVYLNPQFSEQRGRELAGELTARPEIKQADFVSSDQGLSEFQSFSGLGDVLASLDRNPLPAVIKVQPVQQQASEVEALKLLLEGLPEADDVQLDLLWVERLNRIAQIASRLVVVLSCLLGIAVLLVVGNTIRLAIESRRDEIIIVKLVGGTNAFVRRPFLYQGLWYGIAGGLAAWLLVSISYWYLQSPVNRLMTSLTGSFQFVSLSGQDIILLVAGSVLISLCGAALAVRRHIRQIEPS